MIPTNKKGLILEGEHQGWYVLVQDDVATTGGYYILISKNENFEGGLGGGFDAWLEEKQFVEDYFRASEWKIKWL